MTVFWADQCGVLLNKKYISQIFPSKGYSNVENLNAIMRFSIFVSISSYAMTRKPWTLSIMIFGAFVTLLLNEHEKSHKKVSEEKFGSVACKSAKNKSKVETSGKGCREPTQPNPFMNPPVTDFDVAQKYEDGACSVNNKNVRRKMNKYFNDGTFRDFNDFYGRNGGRQFYTVAASSIPSNQENFLNYVYGGKNQHTCKTNSCYCQGYGYGASGSTSLAMDARNANSMNNIEELEKQRDPRESRSKYSKYAK